MTITARPMPTPAKTPPAHPTLRVYNTLSRQKEPFRTVQPGRVGIYLCGPTVYDKAHIGHMVGPVIFDCIKRYLEYCGYDVTWVVNITDVDDKLIKKANERGISMLQVAEENIADYNQNLSALGVDQVDHFPRATECMPDIVDFIAALIERGFAYESDGDVYFDVARDREYGKLSNRSLDSVQGDGGTGSDRKRHAADFALWKAAKSATADPLRGPGEPSWDSPWGAGRPGWHIECSAMSKKILGETFDIHGGGLDLIFPHHENEIAQSECCHAKPMVTYWVHNGLLRAGNVSGKIGGRTDRGEPASAGGQSAEEQASGKMSRSKGAGGLATLIERQGGERIRFFLLRTHYRSTVLFNEPAIEEAGVGLETFYRLFKRYTRITGKDFYELKPPAIRTAPNGEPASAGGSDPVAQATLSCRQKFLTAMDDDFNTGGAIGEIFELARIINKFCDGNDLEGKGKTDNAKIAQLTSLLTTLRELTNILGIFIAPTASPLQRAGDDLAQKLLPLINELRPTSSPLPRPGEGLGKGSSPSADELMKLLIQLRADARKSKDFATADKIRKRLTEIGITLEDRAGGTEWTKM
jgi:cysteinyl-tRNA synthetase